MAKEINIKEVVTDMIVVYLKNTYKKSSINLDPAIISKSLNDYEEQDLFDKVFYGFEDFMSDLFNNKWYDIASNNCKVNFGVFTDFMNTTKIQKVLVKHNLSWIDCFLSAVNGDKDICDSIYGEINKSNEAVDLAAHYRNLRVQENCIEIALQCFDEISRTTDMPRDIIVGKIQDWALQAEKLWEERDDDDCHDYYDFIDEFTNAKKTEYLAEFKSSLTNNTNEDEKASKIAGKYAMEYTLEGTTRCTYEEVAESIEEAIKEYTKNN